MSADFIDGNKALLLRRAILLQLEAASPASLPPDALSAGLEIYALPSDPKTLSAALTICARRGLWSFPIPAYRPLTSAQSLLRREGII